VVEWAVVEFAIPPMVKDMFGAKLIVETEDAKGV